MYKFYNKSNELICLNENENCNEKFKFSKENSKECLEKCPENKFIFNNKCLSKCENEKKPNGKKCLCRFKYFYNNSILNCLNKNENCPSDFPYLNKNQCLIECPKNSLIFKMNVLKNVLKIIINLIQLV